MLRVVESICVVVPFTSKFPFTVKFEPVTSTAPLNDDVKVLKSVRILPLALSKEVNLPDALDVKVFKLPVAVCKESNLLFCVVSTELLELVKLLKSVRMLPLALSKEVNLPLAEEVNVFKLPEHSHEHSLSVHHHQTLFGRIFQNLS